MKPSGGATGMVWVRKRELFSSADLVLVFGWKGGGQTDMVGVDQGVSFESDGCVSMPARYPVGQLAPKRKEDLSI